MLEKNIRKNILSYLRVIKHLC